MESLNISENKKNMLNSDIIIYTTEDGKTEIKVTVNEETIWLNQYQLEELFNTNRTSIVRHISNIYNSGELEKESTCAKIAQVQTEGIRQIKRQVNYYNLDLIEILLPSLQTRGKLLVVLNNIN